MSIWEKINFKDFSNRIKLGSHKETIPFFIVTCIGSLFPLLIGVIFLAKKGDAIELKIFYSAGEFYLYSAAFLTSAGYIFYNYKEKNYDIYSIFCLIAAIIVVLDAVIYALLISDNKNTDKNFIRWTSIIFLLVSFLVYYIASYLNIKNIEFLKAERKATDKIKNQLPDYGNN